MSDIQLDLSEFKECFFEEAEKHLRAIEEGLLCLEKTPNDRELLNSVYRSAHTIKGNSGMLELTDLVAFTHAVESLLDRMRSDRLVANDELVTLLLSAADGLSDLIRAAKDESPCPSSTDAVLRRLEGALEMSHSSPSLDLESSEPVTSTDFNAPATDPPAKLHPTESRAANSGHSFPPDSIRVSTEKVDVLLSLATELMIADSMVQQVVTQLSSAEQSRMEEALMPLNRAARQLREQILALRLVPISATFRRFPRVVRDLAKALGKNVRLQIEGEATELDRHVVEQVADALTHLIRNSVDHGIERPEHRVAAGKPESGMVALRAYHDGGNVIIEVADDGRGLDTRRLQAKAIERGLTRLGEATTDTQLHELIFHPGFSTADTITHISGRGVGMDVVRRNIERLNGSVTVHSNPGNGCVFRVKLPLTSAHMPDA